MIENYQNASRLFFAIWPDQSLRTQLVQWQRALVGAGQPVPPERLHLTLAFLGNVNADVQGQIIEAATQLHLPQFRLRLDHAGFFQRPQIAWLGPQEVPSALSVLQQQLASLVAAHGLELPDKEFKPHITLARKAPQPPKASSNINLQWQVTEFALVRSRLTDNGPEYQTLASFPLYNPAA